MMPRHFVLLIALSLGIAARACAADVDPAKLKIFGPLPDVIESPKNPVTEAKVALGRMLYYDTRLSRAHDVSCDTCHQLSDYGVDREPTSAGHKGQKGNRNSPTVYNAAGHFVQFWDGRAPDVEEQAKGPVMNPVEMAMPSETTVVAVLKSIPGYVAAFKKAFPGEPDAVTFDNMAKAIGAFERGLVTPSRWDGFLKGDRNALAAAERAGFEKFVEVGCVMCHSGPYLGANFYHKLGLVKPWSHGADLGRFALTKNERDKMVFKVPSLRNIEKTSPYYHDGSVASLDEAVRLMAEHQNGTQLSAQEVKSIVSWLRTLTGSIPVEYIRKPDLPPSTSRTPKPSRS
jgi:cytochrome c peroxidase